MALSFFADAKHMPSETDLASALGRAHGAWEEVRTALGADLDGITAEWAYAGKSFGWSLRLKRKKRVIVYLIPGEKRFLVGVVLGERAVRAAPEANLSPQLLDLIARAPRYAEGRGLRVEVRTKKAAAEIRKLAALKAAH